MKLKTLILLFILPLQLSAQEFLITDYYNLPLYLNPAETGTTASNRLQTGFTIRNSYGYYFPNYFFSYDKKINIAKKDYLGIGILFNYAGHGFINSNQTNLLLSCAYSKIIFQNAHWKHFLKAGLNFGGGRAGIDDKIPASHGSFREIDESNVFPSIGLGLSYHTLSEIGLDLEIGGGIFRLNEPNTSYDKDWEYNSPRIKKIHARISHKFNNHVSVKLNTLFMQFGTLEVFTPGAAFGYKFSKTSLELILGSDLFYVNNLLKDMDNYAIKFGLKMVNFNISGALKLGSNSYPGNTYDLILSYTFGDKGE